MANLSPAASVVRPSLLHLKVWKTSSIGTFSYNKYKFHYKLKSKTKSMTPERSKTPKTEHSNTKKNLCEVRIRRKHRKKKNTIQQQKAQIEFIFITNLPETKNPERKKH
jgi:hypothetical protein